MEDRFNNIHKYKYISDGDIPCKKVTPSKLDRLKQKGAFIKGPIDLDWISRAANLPGKALNVALALMYLSGLNKSKVNLKLTRTTYELFNVSRSAVYSALNNMEKDGLIKVKKSQGRKNVITILESGKNEPQNKEQL